MGLFDFFKKKTTPESTKKASEKKFSKDEVDKLILIAMNLLCDGKSTYNDAVNLVKSHGCTDQQAKIIADKAQAMYQKYFEKTSTDNASNTVGENTVIQDSGLYKNFSKYNEYVARFLNMQQQGNYAPIAAYEKPNGEIVGFLYIIGGDETYSLSAEEAIARMEKRFEAELTTKNILSYALLYHSLFPNDQNHTIPDERTQPTAITIAFHFHDGSKGKIGLPYTFEKESITYKAFENFSKEENDAIFMTELQPNKEYFADREEITAPESTNATGIIIKLSNTFDVSNMWGGLMGFETSRKPSFGQMMMEYSALVMTAGSKKTIGKVNVSETKYNNVGLRMISHNHPLSFFPVIHTDYVIDVINKEICEWENADRLEAIIKGGGRDTFGIQYFATDYAENRELYHSQKQLNIKISGIAFVLDIYSPEESNSELKYSENFTAYMPNNDLPGYGCFDFIGQVEDYREIRFLENNSQKGYIMKMRLITHDEQADFFTIDLFVSPENMRFSNVEKGMKLTGMFQMQGEISR